MQRRPVAHLPGVGLHQAGNATTWSAVLTVAVRLAVAPPRPPAGASARRVLVGRVEDVPRLVGEHSIDVVGAPAIVVVVHHEPRTAEGGVREVTDRVLGEERAVTPTRAEPRPHVVDVRRASGEARSVSHLRQRRVPPQRLLAAEAERVGARRHVQRHDLDVVRERDVGPRLASCQPAQPVLHFCHDLDPLVGAELQVVGRTLDHHDTDRHRPHEVGARRSLRAWRERLGRGLVTRIRMRRLVRPPLLAGEGSDGFRLAVLLGAPERQRLQSHRADVVQIRDRRRRRWRRELASRRLLDVLHRRISYLRDHDLWTEAVDDPCAEAGQLGGRLWFGPQCRGGLLRWALEDDHVFIDVQIASHRSGPLPVLWTSAGRRAVRAWSVSRSCCSGGVSPGTHDVVRAGGSGGWKPGASQLIPSPRRSFDAVPARRSAHAAANIASESSRRSSTSAGSGSL